MFQNNSKDIAHMKTTKRQKKETKNHVTSKHENFLFLKINGSFDSKIAY